MGTGIEDVFVANLAPVGSLQETVNLYELLNAKDAEITRLRRALDLSGIPAQAQLDDKAPPLRTTVEKAREITEAINVPT